MYTLYYSKRDKEIRVEKAKNIFKELPFADYITTYNDCYLFCKKKKPLIEKAEEIKNKWLNEAKNELESILKIKI